jgi:hypothetical protein
VKTESAKRKGRAFPHIGRQSRKNAMCCGKAESTMPLKKLCVAKRAR